jgi:hypothetical protein
MKKVLYFFYVLSIGSCLTIKKSFESIDGNRYKFSLSESKGISEIHIENKKSQVMFIIEMRNNDMDSFIIRKYFQDNRYASYNFVSVTDTFPLLRCKKIEFKSMNYSPDVLKKTFQPISSFEKNLIIAAYAKFKSSKIYKTSVTIDSIKGFIRTGIYSPERR